MSQFEDLIREWDEMMCMESDAASLEEHEISFAQEQRILDLTAEYIHKLGGIQKESDHRGSQFADRLLRTVHVGERDRDQVREICQRFLSSVGMIFRDEISRDLPRAKRLAARQFVIDWSTGDFLGRWPDLSVEFSIRDSLVYCVEHIAGAVEKLGDAIVSQYLAELREGNVRIPRLTLKAKVAYSLIFQWEDASISLGDPTLATSTSHSQFIKSPIFEYFSELLEQSQQRLEHELMSKADPENPNVVTSWIIDEMELTDSDPIHDQISNWLVNVGKYSEISQEHLVRKLAEVAYIQASEAIAREQPKAIEKRVKVVKSLNSLRRKQNRAFAAN
jgi:hypothetical protein